MDQVSPDVRVEVVELDGRGGRQITAADRATELLSKRGADVIAAIRLASKLARDALSAEVDEGWQVKRLEAAFGLTLTAEAGVIVGKASTQASFEITITIEHGDHQGQ